jgi:hypothetical protein
MLDVLFDRWVMNADEWVHWTTIRDAIYDEKNRAGITYDHIGHHGDKLRQDLLGKDRWGWEISLRSSKQTADKSLHWKLDIKATSVRSAIDDEPFAPEFKWQVEQRIRRMPVWFPFDPADHFDFILSVSTIWKPPVQFPEYEAFKVKRWQRRESAREADHPICSYRSYRRLPLLTCGTLPIMIDVAQARHSAFCATNEQIIEWFDEEGESERVKEFKRKLGTPGKKEHFPPNSANPIAVTVNIVTSDGKLLFTRSSATNRWDCPTHGLINPLLDVQRPNTLSIYPHEAFWRMLYYSTGITLQRQIIRWNGLALSRESGIVALLGDVHLDIDSQQLGKSLRLQWGANAAPSLFIDFNPEAIVKFLNGCDSLPRHLFEVGLALSLKREFRAVRLFVQPEV